jgi:hypothetical protein
VGFRPRPTAVSDPPLKIVLQATDEGSEVSAQVFTSAMYLGSCLLAIWVYVRLPILRPRSLAVAAAHIVASLAVVHAAPVLVGAAGWLLPAPYSVALAVGAVVAPSLCYLFASWLWLLGRVRDSFGPRGGHPADVSA